MVLVEVALDRADLALERGAAPDAALADAGRWLERARDLSADPGDLALFGAEIELQRARAAALGDRDPAAFVAGVDRQLAALTGADQGHKASVEVEGRLLLAWWAARSGAPVGDALRAAERSLTHLPEDGEGELLRSWVACLAGGAPSCAGVPELLARYPSAGFHFGYLRRLPGGPSAAADRASLTPAAAPPG
jgi:hypothetical protein